jgi:hypothetical protein
MRTDNKWSRSLPHVCAFALFLLLTLVYFYPVFEGKILQQGDITNYQGMAHELEEYGKPSGWTGTMFGGMPSYHITGYTTGTDFMLKLRENVLGAFHSNTAGPILVFLFTAYLLFLVLGAPVWLAAIGAVAMVFSSYNIIIIEAGHVTKAWTLAFVPLLLSGMFLLFQGKYWRGFVVFALGLALTIGANHLQITYYAGLFCVFLFAGFWIECIGKKNFKHAGRATGLLIAGGVLAVLASSLNLYLNYESGQESMRGKSELTPLNQDADQVTAPASTGLDKDYVFTWSYGRGETLSLLIPNVKGGASSGMLGTGSHVYRELRAHGYQTPRDGVQSYTYWGDKPFTSGPVYLGAVVCFLFVLALLVVPGRIKWCLLAAAVFFVFLAWGRNFAVFNDWMYYHFPLYSKFRAVETALVIPAFIFPILAVWGIHAWTGDALSDKRRTRSLCIAGGVTAGICLLLWLAPGVFFHFKSGFDAGVQAQNPEWYYAALLQDRRDLLSGDALRSLIYIALAVGLLFFYARRSDRKKALPVLVVGLVTLILVDLWSIDKRYLNEKDFLGKRHYKEQQFAKSVADEAILQDPDPSYRVLNLNNPFNESRTSYYHKSLGGYHAAKLGRYQDLIDRRLMPELQSIIAAGSTATTLEELAQACTQCPTLNMLNTRYIIYNPEQPPIVNPAADGNAWFVHSYRLTDTPDDEMAALEALNPRTEAVLDRQFEGLLTGLDDLRPDSTASIEMTSYAPDRLEYQSTAAYPGLAIFSEMYYKNGWKAFIDGQPAAIGRADWTLRALTIPAGEHRIEFVFDPDDVHRVGVVTTLFSGLLLLLAVGTLGYALVAKGKKWRRNNP